MPGTRRIDPVFRKDAPKVDKYTFVAPGQLGYGLEGAARTIGQNAKATWSNVERAGNMAWNEKVNKPANKIPGGIAKVNADYTKSYVDKQSSKNIDLLKTGFTMNDRWTDFLKWIKKNGLMK